VTLQIGYRRAFEITVDAQGGQLAAPQATGIKAIGALAYMKPQG
jgi:hypothetical protein